MSGGGKLMRYLSQLYALRNGFVPRFIVQQSHYKGKPSVGMSSEQVCVKELCITATAQQKNSTNKRLILLASECNLVKDPH